MHIWTALLLIPTGFIVGRLTAPLITPYCGTPTKARRRAIAALVAAVFGTLGWRFGAAADLLAFLYLGAVGTLLAVIDIAVKRLPDPFTLPSYVVGAALLGLAVPFTEDGAVRFLHAVIGMVVLWLVYAVQHFFAPNAIGRGDVKLSGVLGLYLGWLGQPSWMLGVVAGFVLGGLVSVALLLARRATRKSEIPFGPFMLAGAAVAVLTGGSAAL